MLDELKAEILRELGDAAEAGRLTTKNSRVLAVLAHIQRHEGLDAGRRIVSWASGVPFRILARRERCSWQMVAARIDRSLALALKGEQP
jgi:hypothetical protein